MTTAFGVRFLCSVLCASRMLLKANMCVVLIFRVMYVPVSVPPNVPLEAVQPVFHVFPCTVSLIIVTNIILVHFEMRLGLLDGRLRMEDCATSIEYGLRPGESKLDELDTDLPRPRKVPWHG